MVARWVSVALSLWLMVSVFVWPHNAAESVTVGLYWAFLFGLLSAGAFVEPTVRYGAAALGFVLAVYALFAKHEVPFTRWHDFLVGAAFVALAAVRSPGLARHKLHPERRIAVIRETTDRALAGETVGVAPFDALRVVAAECAIPRRFMDDHLAGFALDAEGWRPASEDDLLRYCYHVAGAVGCMMAVLMGVAPDDQDTLDRACDLGLAFQLSNIARDIVEDHGVGRVYVPSDWGTVDPRDRTGLAAMAERLAALVSSYEASARVGAARLPFRARWAVLSAAAIYGGIARKVVARGTRAWDNRTVVHKPEKLAMVINALVECGDRPAPVGRTGLWTRPT